MEYVGSWEFPVFAGKKEHCVNPAVELGICIEAYKPRGSEIFKDSKLHHAGSRNIDNERISWHYLYV